MVNPCATGKKRLPAACGSGSAAISWRIRRADPKRDVFQIPAVADPRLASRRIRMPQVSTALPNIVSEAEWRVAAEALRAKEKELTRARDALAAERRRLPMFRVEKEYTFDGPKGDVRLLDLFDGRPQLLLYHFMFAPGVHGWPSAGCPGCSMFLDSLGEYARIHLNARDASFAVVARAPLENIEAYRQRMQWDVQWVSSAKNSFNT